MQAALNSKSYEMMEKNNASSDLQSSTYRVCKSNAVFFIHYLCNSVVLHYSSVQKPM